MPTKIKPKRVYHKTFPDSMCGSVFLEVDGTYTAQLDLEGGRISRVSGNWHKKGQAVKHVLNMQKAWAKR